MVRLKQDSKKWCTRQFDIFLYPLKHPDFFALSMNFFLKEIKNIASIFEYVILQLHAWKACNELEVEWNIKTIYQAGFHLKR